MVKRTEHNIRSECPVACALDVVGDHWTLLIIRDLMFLGRHEYKDMLAAEEGISSNILSDRLKKMECTGLIASIPHPESGRRKLYYLTDKGKDLIYMLLEMVRWSERNQDEIINIPPDAQAALDNDPQDMIDATLNQLAEWEKQHGIG